MIVLDWPRRSGKTTFLINKAIAECRPVLVQHSQNAKILRDQFKYPYIYSNPDRELAGSKLQREWLLSPWFVDEIDYCKVPDWMSVEIATKTDRKMEQEILKYLMGVGDV